MDIGGSLGAFFDADAGGNGLIELGDFDETLGYGGFANRSATRYALRNLDTSPAFPALVGGTSTASTLMVDGLGNITGGSVTLNVAVPTGTFGDLTIDVDAGTWEFYLGGGSLLTARGTGSFDLIASPPSPEPPPSGGGISTGVSIPAMPPFMMVFSGLGLLLLARQHLQP